MSKNCPNCGVATKSDDVFCPYCGSSMTSSQASSDSSFPDSQYSDQFATSTPHSEESYSYGSGGYYSEPADSTRKWYQPPKRKRSAKHPVEWFFWLGWGLYMLLRILFFVLIIVAQVAGKRR